mmetsp:Transcript_15239/g.16917  ORF Transcript_15239/g.16917 Transcript_15239/m.16917 type:complete len:432 (+) Transcript_15239:160-1455(+)
MFCLRLMNAMSCFLIISAERNFFDEKSRQQKHLRTRKARRKRKLNTQRNNNNNWEEVEDIPTSESDFSVARAIDAALHHIHKPDSSLSSRIVGGRTVDANEHNFFTLLMRKGLENQWQSNACGASLIDSCWVVTAAHCVYDSDDNIINEGLGVYVNAWRPYNSNDGHERHIAEVSQIYTQESYNPSSSDQRYDIALLRLKKCAPNTFDPVELLPPSIELSGDLTVVGLGNTDEAGRNPTVKTLQDAEVKYIPNQVCNNYYSNPNSGFVVYDDMICAGYEEGNVDACQGDSGGPLVKYINNIPHQVGVVSWGVGCARYRRPGVYSAIQHQVTWDWMKAKVCNNHETDGIKLCGGSGYRDDDLLQAPQLNDVAPANCENGRGVIKPDENLRFRCDDMIPDSLGHSYCASFDADLNMRVYDYCPNSCNAACYNN